MGAKYEFHRTYPFYKVTLSRLSIYHYLVCNSMGCTPTGSPVDLSYIMSYKSHNTYHIDLEVFVFERGQKKPTK